LRKTEARAPGSNNGGEMRYAKETHFPAAKPYLEKDDSI
jgi:hypothetical protein